MTISTATMQRLATEADAARKATADAIAALNERTEFTADARAEKARDLRDQLAATAGDLAEKYRAEKARLATADRIADTRAPDVQMLDDSRRATAWDRARQRLEKGTAWRQIADDAVDTSDTVMLAALADHLADHLTDELPAGTAGRRTRAAGIRVDVQQNLDPLLAAHGDGVHQQAAQARQQAATATGVADVAIAGAQAESQGRYDPLAASIAAHYAQANADATAVGAA